MSTIFRDFENSGMKEDQFFLKWNIDTWKSTYEAVKISFRQYELWYKIWDFLGMEYSYCGLLGYDTFIVIWKVGIMVLEEDRDSIFLWNTVTHLWDYNIMADPRRPQYIEFYYYFQNMEAV